MTTRRVLVLAAAAALAATLVGAPSAQARADTRAGADPPGLGRAVIQGARGFGGCMFSGSLELGVGEDAVAERALAVDTTTCSALVERGRPTDAELAAGDDAPSRVADQRQAKEEGRGFAASSRILATHSKGYLKTFWEDPVQIDVNSVRNDTDWHWNGNCVVSPVYGSYSYGWYSPSGWQLKENNWQNSFTCTQSRSSSYAHFKNPYFCLTIDTHAYYDRNTVNGRANGNLVGTWNSWVSGGCTGLLHFNHVLKRTLN